MTRARARALETEVNSFLLDLHMDTNGTCILPHQNMLCILRYEVEHYQGAQEHPQGEGEPPQGHKDQGVQQQQNSMSQVTPCARAQRPRAHGLHRNPALEHPVRTGLYRAHGTPVRTDPTYPVRTGLPGWPAEFGSSAPLRLLRPQAYTFRT